MAPLLIFYDPSKTGSVKGVLLDLDDITFNHVQVFWLWWFIGKSWLEKHEEKLGNYESIKVLRMLMYIWYVYIYIYLEPTWPLFWKFNPPNQPLFQSQPGSLRGSRYFEYIHEISTHGTNVSRFLLKINKSSLLGVGRIYFAHGSITRR